MLALFKRLVGLGARFIYWMVGVFRWSVVGVMGLVSGLACCSLGSSLYGPTWEVRLWGELSHRLAPGFQNVLKEHGNSHAS